MDAQTPAFKLDPTPENAALVAATAARMRADARLVTGKAALWKLGGIGALLALLGVGVGAGLYGYSFVNDSRTSADKMAQAFSDAIKNVTINTTGEVKVAEGGKVAIEPGATVGVDGEVRLNADGATVKLDPSSKIAIQNAATPQLPSQRQLTGTGTNTNTAVVTNFTIFKGVPFGKGRVVSGWNFNDNTQSTPTNQYCYYTETIEQGADIKLDLANDGRMMPNIKPRPGVSVETAAQNCQWFDGSGTRTF